MDRNYCLIVFIVYICHTVIHRKFKNVVYMKKKSMFKKRGRGNQRHYRVSCPQVLVIKLYTIYTSTVNREMELDGRTNSPIYLPQL